MNPAPCTLSVRTEELIQQLFTPDEQVYVRTELCEKCSLDALGCTGWTENQMERLWFAVLKIASEGAQPFEAAVALVKTDWRDALVQAGFGNDLDAHEIWRRSVV